MRTTHLLAILALMPSEVQTGIKAVDKMTSAGSQSSTINTSSDKLFLLSEIEIFGSITSSKSGEGSQYAYYSAGNSEVKNFSGSAYIWWERSPNGSKSTNFCYVNSSGGGAAAAPLPPRMAWPSASAFNPESRKNPAACALRDDQEREKLRKFRSWMEEGRMTIEDIRTAYDSWRGHMKRGNSWRVLRRMDRFYNKLFA